MLGPPCLKENAYHHHRTQMLQPLGYSSFRPEEATRSALSKSAQIPPMMANHEATIGKSCENISILKKGADFSLSFLLKGKSCLVLPQ